MFLDNWKITIDGILIVICCAKSDCRLGKSSIEISQWLAPDQEAFGLRLADKPGCVLTRKPVILRVGAFMRCRQCVLLSKQFSAAINRHAALRFNDLAALKAADHELELSSAEIATLRKQLLDHEATHAEKN